VLRSDGTFFLNLGDSYAANRGYQIDGTKQTPGSQPEIGSSVPAGLKPKDLCGIPQRAMLALQADGWYVRSFIPWVKRNPMPNSQNDRPTTSTEYVMLLTKQEDYFFDMEAVKMPASVGNNRSSFTDKRDTARHGNVGQKERTDSPSRSLRESDFFFASLRAILDDKTSGLLSDENPLAMLVNTQGYKGAHFATWPPKLVEIMVKAGTSERGCCKNCGAQFERVVEKESFGHDDTRPDNNMAGRTGNGFDRAKAGYVSSTTTGWRATCSCGGDPAPCRVLDPFAGSGTSLMVARQLGRDAGGVDLSEQYLNQEATSRLMLDTWAAWETGKSKEAAGDFDGLPMFINQEKIA